MARISNEIDDNERQLQHKQCFYYARNEKKKNKEKTESLVQIK